MHERFNRRRFVQVAAAAVSTLSAAPEYKGKILDTHVHFYDPTRPQGVPWPPAKEELLYQRTLPDRFRQATRGLGISGVIVVEASAWLEDNQWLLDLARDESLIVGIVGRLKPGEADFPKHLERFGRNKLFRGIRLGGNQIGEGIRNPLFLDHIRRMAAGDLQLDAIGNHAMLADLLHLTDKAPGLRVVIDHMPFDPPSDKGVMKQIAGRPQIYCKVSGVLRSVAGKVADDVETYRAGLEELWDVFGPSRLIYASNWPVSDKLAPYATVLKVVKDYFATKGSQAEEGYFWKNSQSAYKWAARS